MKVTLIAAGSSGSPNTLNVVSGAASDGQKRVIEVYSASDLGGDVYLQITPVTFFGYYFIRNSLAGSRSLRIFQGTYSVGNTVLLANGYDAVIRCDGAATPIVSLVLSNIQGTVLNATNTAITNDAATAVAVYPTWVTANTGNLPQKTTSTRLSFVPSTGVLSATSFSGAGTGLTGTAASLTVGAATNTAITDNTGTATAVYPTWVTVTTGSGGQFITSSKLTFVPSTGVLSATSFSGAGTGLTGTATSLTAGTATNATNTAITNDVSTGVSVYPTWVTANTGNLPQKTSSASLSFVPLTGVLSATAFSGDGSALNNVTASDAINAANTTINNSAVIATSVYPTWVNGTGGNLPQNVTSGALSFVPTTGILTATGFAGALNGTVGATTPSTGRFTTLALSAPSSVNASTYSVATTDVSLRFTTTNCTVTLPAAASFTGRVLYLNTITANSVTSASSNVIPLGSNTAGTAILAATAGKFAMIQSDGSNWITMMAN